MSACFNLAERVDLPVIGDAMMLVWPHSNGQLIYISCVSSLSVASFSTGEIAHNTRLMSLEQSNTETDFFIVMVYCHAMYWVPRWKMFHHLWCILYSAIKVSLKQRKKFLCDQIYVCNARINVWATVMMEIGNSTETQITGKLLGTDCWRQL